MIGAILNSAGILIGGIYGMCRRKPMSPATEGWLRTGLGAFTAFFGLRLLWMSVNGPALTVLKQMAIVTLAFIGGRLIGKLLRLQRMSNALGRMAKERIEAASRGQKVQGDGFKVCAALFCAAPLAWLGAVQDGLTGYFAPLAIKGVLEGFAARGFVPIFGGWVALAAVPVLALEGTVTLVCMHWLEPYLKAHGLVDSINATGGLLVSCVALIMLGLKRIELSDYLPALAVAPLITAVWK